MRILLDKSLPRALIAQLPGHDVATVRSAAWSGIKNGQLLALAATRFDVFVTADRNLEYQQNLATLPLPVVLLVVRRTRIEAILPLVPELLALLKCLALPTLRTVGA